MCTYTCIHMCVFLCVCVFVCVMIRLVWMVARYGETVELPWSEQWEIIFTV